MAIIVQRDDNNSKQDPSEKSKKKLPLFLNEFL